MRKRSYINQDTFNGSLDSATTRFKIHAAVEFIFLLKSNFRGDIICCNMYSCFIIRVVRQLHQIRIKTKLNKAVKMHSQLYRVYGHSSLRTHEWSCVCQSSACDGYIHPV
jgi:hypothetical protein